MCVRKYMYVYMCVSLFFYVCVYGCGEGRDVVLSPDEPMRFRS